MVTEQSRIVHYLALLIATTAVSNGVQSVPVVTTNAPSPNPKGPSPGPPFPASNEALVAKSSPPTEVADSQSHRAPHQSAGESTIAPGIVRSSISIAPLIVATANSKRGVEKIDLWLSPICEHLEKIAPKQAFKIQSQFKKIIELTNGKLSICFLEHYKIDPSLNPISKAQMTNMCHSRSSPIFKAFLSCAAENWDDLAEKELDAITNARNDHIINHKNDHKDGSRSVASLLDGDDDEAKIILNDAVAKALSDNKSDGGNNDIKMIDLSDKNPAVSSSPKPEPLAPSGSPVTPAKNAADVSSVEKKILNDPNTMMVLMDDTKPPSHLPGPHHSTNLFGPPTVSTTAIPHSNDKTKSRPTTMNPTAPSHNPAATKASIQTTTKPIPINNGTNKPESVRPTTEKPHLGEIGTSSESKPALESTKQISTIIRPIMSSSKPSSKVTGEPSSRSAIESHSTAVTTTTASPQVKPITTSSLPTKIPTEKPLETLETVLKRQEAEKIEFEKRLKMERDSLIKKLQKKQDEIDAQNAIAAMQSHRNHATDHDSRMHQIEHERQMSIDPIGHTLKHQQFEIRKQQRLGG